MNTQYGWPYWVFIGDQLYWEKLSIVFKVKQKPGTSFKHLNEVSLEERHARSLVECPEMWKMCSSLKTVGSRVNKDNLDFIPGLT